MIRSGEALPEQSSILQDQDQDQQHEKIIQISKHKFLAYDVIMITIIKLAVSAAIKRGRVNSTLLPETWLRGRALEE